MRVETDPEVIAGVLKDPAVFPFIRDDVTPDEWMPNVSDNQIFLMPDDDSACFIFSQHSGVLAEGHFAVLPEARGKGLVMADAALDWLRENTEIRAVMGLVNPENLPACRFVERLGFIQRGTLPNAFSHGGHLTDLSIYSLEL